MIRVGFEEDTRIFTNADRRAAYHWVRARLGDSGKTWVYGKSEDFLGSTFVSGPEEIEYIEFENEEDAVAFKLTF
jgi:hypothetical protein